MNNISNIMEIIISQFRSQNILTAIYPHTFNTVQIQTKLNKSLNTIKTILIMHVSLFLKNTLHTYEAHLKERELLKYSTIIMR